MPNPIRVKIPENPTGDPWLNLFKAQAMRYAEVATEDDISELDMMIAQYKHLVLSSYGLHLNV